MTDEEWEQQRRAHLAFRATVGFLATEHRRSPAGSFRHGTRFAYDKKKCKCEVCVDWHRVHQRERNMRRSLRLQRQNP
jgi:hypothetical protein